MLSAFYHSSTGADSITAMIEQSFDVLIRHEIIVIAAFIVCVALLMSFVITTTTCNAGLKGIPGPWYAPYTSLHLKYLFARGTIWKYVEGSHRKYGDVIRLGPRQIWCSSPIAMSQILSTVDLPKVTMYAEISRDRNSPGLFGEM